MIFFRDYAYLNGYLPVFLFMVIALAAAAAMLMMAYIVRPSRPNPEKLSPYECGILPTTGTRERFSIRFYLIAVLFLLFDLEAVFLYPWAVVYKRIGLFGFIEMIIFLIILLVGYFYAWKKGALEWV